MRAETSSRSRRKARFLCARLKPVNDLFAQNTHFFRPAKKPEKSARFEQNQTIGASARTFDGRNDLNLSIRLTGFKHNRRFAGASQWVEI
jgi:hypothetical protein